MWFGYLTLAVAFFLSVVAAYYSVLGLVAIFSAAVIPVMIMGGALETGKVIAAMWLHRNWHRAPWTYKAYLLPSLLALMLLTSMGTFGYLSKAHSDQSLVSGDVTSKIAIYDEKIRIAKENIDGNRAALKQLDAAVDQIMGRSTTESGAERSVQIRRQQAPERQRLIRDIETEQKKISELNEARAPIAAEVRKVEAEVGPIKYIAALIYGDTTDNNLLESAVRWVIILIVVVFDPLAIVLILAGSRHLEWERQLRAPPTTTTSTTSTSTSTTSTTSSTTTSSTTTTTTQPPSAKQVYLERPWVGKVPGIRLPPQVYRADEPKHEIIQHIEDVKDILPEYRDIPLYTVMDNEHVIIDGAVYHHRVLKDIGYGDILVDLERKKSGEVELDLLPKPDHEASFGREFPRNPTRGQMHVSIATVPSKLYKYNGNKWIEVDKNISDSYTHNEAYIRYIIKCVENGEIAPEDLTQNEQDLVFEYLKNVKSNYNPTR
jgi:hypothetical protein